MGIFLGITCIVALSPFLHNARAQDNIVSLELIEPQDHGLPFLENNMTDTQTTLKVPESVYVGGAVSAAAFIGFGVIYKTLQRRHKPPNNASSDSTPAAAPAVGTYDGFCIELSPEESCQTDDVMISVEFLPSSPSSQSAGQDSGRGDRSCRSPGD